MSLDKTLLGIAKSAVDTQRKSRDGRNVVSKSVDAVTNKSYANEDKKVAAAALRKWENEVWKPKTEARLKQEMSERVSHLKPGSDAYNQTYQSLYNKNHQGLQAAKAKAYQQLGTLRQKGQTQRQVDNRYTQKESLRNNTAKIQSAASVGRDVAEEAAGALATGTSRALRYPLQLAADVGENDDGSIFDRGAKALERHEDNLQQVYPAYADTQQNGSFTENLTLSAIEQIPNLALSFTGAGAAAKGAQLAGAGAKMTAATAYGTAAATMYPQAYGDGSDSTKDELENATAEQLATAKRSQGIYKEHFDKNIKDGLSEDEAYAKARDQTISSIAEQSGDTVGLATLALSMIAPGVGTLSANKVAGGAVSKWGQKVFNKLASKTDTSKVAKYAVPTAIGASVAGLNVAEEALQEGFTDYTAQQAAIDVGVKDELDIPQIKEAVLMGGILGGLMGGGTHIASRDTKLRQAQAGLKEAQQTYAQAAEQIPQLQQQIEAVSPRSEEGQALTAQLEETKAALNTMVADAERQGIPRSSLARHAPRIEPTNNTSDFDGQIDGATEIDEQGFDEALNPQGEPAPQATPDTPAMSEQELDAQDAQIAELIAEQQQLDEAIEDGSNDTSLEESLAAAQNWYDKQRGEGQEGLSGVVRRAAATEQDAAFEQQQESIKSTTTSINDYIAGERSKQRQIDVELEQDAIAAKSEREKAEVAQRAQQREIDRAQEDELLATRAELAQPYDNESFDTTVVGADGAPFNLARFWDSNMPAPMKAKSIADAFSGQVEQNVARSDWASLPDGVQKDLHNWFAERLDGVRQEREGWDGKATTPEVEQPQAEVPTATGLTMPEPQTATKDKEEEVVEPSAPIEAEQEADITDAPIQPQEPTQLTDENPVINIPAPGSEAANVATKPTVSSKVSQALIDKYGATKIYGREPWQLIGENDYGMPIYQHQNGERITQKASGDNLGAEAVTPDSYTVDAKELAKEHYTKEEVEAARERGQARADEYKKSVAPTTDEGIYKSKPAAKAAIKKQKLDPNSVTINQVKGGGFEIVPNAPAKPSYAQAQEQAATELGMTLDDAGEYQGTDAEFEAFANRVDEIQGRSLDNSKPTPQPIEQPTENQTIDSELLARNSKKATKKDGSPKYFLSDAKSQQFIIDNNLGETHEVVDRFEGKQERFEILPKQRTSGVPQVSSENEGPVVQDLPATTPEVASTEKDISQVADSKAEQAPIDPQAGEQSAPAKRAAAKRAKAQPKQTNAETDLAEKHGFNKDNKLDHGELSIPNRTKDIDKQVDSYKKDKAKLDADKLEEVKAKNTKKAEAEKERLAPIKEQAQAEYKKHGTAMVKAYKGKLEAQGVNARDFIRDEAKYNPESFLKLSKKFQEEQQAEPKSSTSAIESTNKPNPTGDWQTQVNGNEFRINEDGVTVRKHDRVVHIRGANSIAANKKAKELANQDIRELHYITAKEDANDPFSEGSIWLDGNGDMVRKKGTKKPTGSLLPILKQAETKKPTAKKADKPAKKMVKSSRIAASDSQIDAVRKQYEGTDKWMKAPNGKKSNLNEQQWLQARTPAFKEWFGDWENDAANASKILDANGEPMVVYHGSSAKDIDVFRDSPQTNGLLFFTENKGDAVSYSNGEKSGYMDMEYAEDKANLDIARDYLIENGDSDMFNGALLSKNISDETKVSEFAGDSNIGLVEAIGDKLRAGKVSLSGAIDEINAFISSLYREGKVYGVFLNVTKPYNSKTNPVSWQEAEKMGSNKLSDSSDGIFVTEDDSDAAIAVYNPNQIKSADDNAGTFDASNPDIRYSKTNPAKGNTGTTPKQVVSTLQKRFGKEAVAKLIKSGKLRVRTLNDFVNADGQLLIPNDAEGFYYDGKVALIADNLTDNTAVAAMLHEMGGHAGIQNMLAPQTYMGLMDNFDALVKSDNKYAVKAKERAEASTDTETEAREEYIPYLITEYAQATERGGPIGAIKRFVDRVMAGVRTWVRNNTGVQLKLTPNDITQLAERMIKRLADQKNNPMAVAGYSNYGESAATGNQAQLSQAPAPQSEIDTVREQYEGTDKWMKAPNGKKSNLNEQQWLQARTPAFKEWFGDWEGDAANASKVVDSNGEPKVMYHGSPIGETFNVFKGDDNGSIYTSDNREYANNYANDADGLTKGVSADKRLFEVFVKSDNYFDNTNSKHVSKLADAILENNETSDAGNGETALVIDGEKSLYAKDVIEFTLQDGEGYNWRFMKEPWTQKAIKALDFDGFSVFEGGGEVSVAVYNSNQVKSATDNAGTFDSSNNDIRYSRRYSSADQNEDAATKRERASSAVRLGVAATAAANNGTVRILRRHVATPQHVALLNPDFKKFTDNVQARLAYENNEAGKVQVHVPEIWQTRLLVGKRKETIKKVSTALFDGTMADKVWSDDELASKFKLTPKQIDLYGRMRASINDSLGNMTVDTLSALAKGTKLVNIETINRLKLTDSAPKDHNTAMQKYMVDELERLDKGGLISKAAVTRMQGQLDEAFKVMDSVTGKFDQLVENGYAPLMRFGDYAVEVRNKETGDLDLFELYEGNDVTGPLAQWKAIKDLEKKYDLNEYSISKGTLNPDAFKQFTDKGLNPETVQLFASELGLDSDGAIQAYLKVAISDRSALKRLIHRKKIPGYSEDMPRVVSAFVMSNARHSGRMLYNGEIENSIQKIKDGNLQGEAQNVFKNMEDPQEEYAGVRNTMFHWFMAFSPAFLLLNLTQPFTQTIPKLGAYTSATRAHTDMAHALGIVGKYSGKATWNATKWVAGKDDPNWQGFEDHLPAWVKKEDYLRMSREGHLDPQNVWMIRGLERGKTGIASGAWGGFENLAGWPAEVSEGINRRSTMIAAFKVAKRMGPAKLKQKGFNSDYEFAVSVIQQTQGVYNKGNRSGLARGTGKLGQFGPLVMVFKQFTINYVEQMIRHGRDKEFKSLALMMLWQFGIAGLFGLPFVDDLRDVMEGGLYRVFGKSFNLKDEMENLMGKTAAQNLMYGVPSNNNPIDFYGRSSMGNLLPLTDFARPGEGDWGEVIGASSSFFENFYTASKYMSEGRVRDAVVVASPRYVKDAVNGYEIYKTGAYRNHRGDKVMDMSKSDGVIKGLGQFNPSSNAKPGRDRSEAYHMKNEIKHNQERYSLALAEAIYQNDDERYDKLYEEMDAWNERNKEPYLIDIDKVETSADNRVEKKDFSSAERNEKALPNQLEEYLEGKQ